MKKKILIILLCCIMLTGCFSKEAISMSKFMGMSSKYNYTLGDVTNQYDSYNVREAVVSKADGYQIEFYVLETVKDANNMFNVNKNDFKKSSGTNTSIKATNYETFKLTNDESYMYICRVDNTLLYVNTDIRYKEQIEEFIKELGY